MTLRNRLVMSPMETMYGTPDGLPSERTRDYFAARAKGGVGLITVGATGIDHHHPETPGGLHLGTDAAVDAHRALVEVVHEHGAKIQPQIVHAGPDGLGPEMHGVTSIGPSVIPSYLTGRPSAEVTHEQLIEVFDLFKAAVRRAAEAGYDGIELHAAHGYMFLGSFLAPQRNRRTDEYRGDSVKGRVRVVLEALAAIRSEIGDALPITLRISGYERVAGGRPMFETAQVAPQLVAAGVDAFHVSGGVIDRLVTGMVNSADDGDALNVGAAAAVKQVVDVPVIAVGRIHDPQRAEQILADGRADFIAMGRPMLADAELPNKVASGHADRVRKCISCENCIDAMEQRFSVDCAVNPRTGKERELAAPRASTPQEGGGDRQRAGRHGDRPGGRRTRTSRHAVRTQQPDRRRAAVGVDPAPRERAVPAVAARRDRPQPGEGRTGTRGFGRRRRRPAARRGGGGQRRSGGAPEHSRCATCRMCRPGRRCASGSAAGDSGWSGPRPFAWRPRRGCRSAIASSSSAPTWSRWNSPNSSPRVAGWCRCSRPTRRSRRNWATSARPNTWTGSTGWALRCMCVPPVDKIVPDGVVFTPYGGTSRRLAADSVVIAGTLQPNTELYEKLVAALPNTAVHAAGDCTGLGLIRKATEDGARAACAI